MFHSYFSLVTGLSDFSPYKISIVCLHLLFRVPRTLFLLIYSRIIHTGQGSSTTGLLKFWVRETVLGSDDLSCAFQLFNSICDLYSPDANSSAHCTQPIVYLGHSRVYLDFANYPLGGQNIKTPNFGLNYKVLWALLDHPVLHSTHPFPQGCQHHTLQLFYSMVDPGPFQTPGMISICPVLPPGIVICTGPWILFLYVTTTFSVPRIRHGKMNMVEYFKSILFCIYFF